MHFTKLKLAGFKSFVEPTELVIEPGLTGIVGPNGCGKSNLVEALQWAMGEASARRLRGGEMDDVIFAGSGTRPARNIASVSLAVELDADEAPGWLSTTPELFRSRDLDVERRIDRGRGSSYRINGRDMRARDVQVMFADAASGAGSAALVGQGRIGWLISARPSERRSLLEEAAGIAGLQSRRHEAELKLAATEQNLLRVGDTAAALLVQIEKLRKQAKQAERYRRLSDEIQLLEAQALLRRDAEAIARVAKARDTLRQAIDETIAADTRASDAQLTRQATAEQLGIAQVSAQEARQAVERLNAEIREIDAEERRIQQQLADLTRRLGELKQDQVREQALEAESVLQRKKAAADRERLLEEQADDGGIASARGKAAKSLTLTQSAEKAMQDASRIAAQREAERSAIARRRSAIEERRQRQQRQHHELTAQSRSADLLAVPEAELDAARAAGKAAEQEVVFAREAADQAEQAVRRARQRENDALTPLRSVQHRRLQLDAEIKGLGKLASSEPVKGFAPVLDQLRVEAGLEAALGAAFGEELLASLDPSAPSWWAVLDDAEPALPLPEGTIALAGLVSAPPQLARRLAHIGLIEDADADAAIGQTMQAQLHPGQSLLTRDGRLWRWDGLVRQASAPTAAAMRLVARNRLAEVEAQLAVVLAELAQADAVHNEAKQALAAAEQAETAVRERVRVAGPALSKVKVVETALVQRANSAEQKQREILERLRRADADLADATGQLEECAGELATLPASENDRQRLAMLARALDEARQDERLSQRTLDGLERDRQQRQIRLSALDQDLAALEGRMVNAEQQRIRLAERQSRLEEERERLGTQPEALNLRRLQTQEGLTATRMTAEEAAAVLKSSEAAAKLAERKAAQETETLSKARENKVRAEAAEEQADEAARTIQIRIVETFGCSPSALKQRLAIEHPDAAAASDADSMEERLGRLKRERDQIGAVNLTAETELTELSTEKESVEQAAEDLKAAVQKLRQAIRELNDEGREKLLAAFKVVNAHFQDLFTRLFGGGQARLELTGAEQDPLQAGLEIMASPPGKRMQILSLLSGGERALTAVALVFAMFLTNPAPICVLDEVDAPLDDANVERFCAMVRHIGERTATRFLIITHHRVTMARMDRLYGVTMVEKGVSQLVSVALREADQLRETA